MKKLEFLDLKVGMRVQDDDGDIGIIQNCHNINKIIVKNESTGSYAFYNLNPINLFKTHYNSLYTVEWIHLKPLNLGNYFRI